MSGPGTKRFESARTRAIAKGSHSSISSSARPQPGSQGPCRSAVTANVQHMAIETMPVAGLRPHPGNARTHSKKQIRQIADSIRQFGFTNPVLIGEDGSIIAGHGRVEAAKLLGLDSVPTVRLAHLNAAQRRAYVLADNKLALNAGWDRELLAIELQGLIELDFDVELTGFSSTQIELVLHAPREGPLNSAAEPEDQIFFPCR
jgi:ParB-like chromosome segregation protein Spo0J